MKKLKASARLLFYALLITLAMIGIGLSGGVPIPSTGSRKDKFEAKTELVERKEDKEKPD